MSARELGRVEVMERLKSSVLDQQEAARVLRLSVRQVKRLWRAYQHAGARGLISRKRGRPSNNRFDPAVATAIVDLLRLRYPDFGPTLAREKLAERHGLHIGLETLRRLMIDRGLWISRRNRKIIVHPMRQRRPCLGELAQIDGSPHAWLEDRGPRCTLLVCVDDATSRLMQLRFVPAETTFAYFALVRAYVRKHGKPLAFYSDRLGVFRVNEPSAGNGKTQFARALAELDIELICANSPQAKGRVERANQTLQDRLIKELRLRGITTVKAANAYVPSFMRDYNRRFARAPLSPHDVHRPLGPTDDLDRSLTLVTRRIVSKDCTVQYHNAIYQILKPQRRHRFSGVDVREDQAGTVTIVHNGRVLQHSVSPLPPRQPIADRKRLQTLADPPPSMKSNSHPNKAHVPAKNHPWLAGSHHRKPVLPDYLRDISTEEAEDIYARD
jgi:homeodomain-containing protein